VRFRAFAAILARYGLTDGQQRLRLLLTERSLSGRYAFSTRLLQLLLRCQHQRGLPCNRLPGAFIVVLICEELRGRNVVPVF
jgi:hypothetical protein